MTLGGLPAEAPAPAATPRRARRKALAKGFASRTGADAIAASEAVKELKEEATVGDSGGTTVRRASGRTFTWKDGAWTDTEWKTGAKILKVAYLSDAYFELLKARPRLKKALALGERVRVMIDESHGSEIGKGGEKKAAGMKAFLK